MFSPPRLLVSACLLGHETRYDGAHKYCASLFDADFAEFELHSICPEMEIGLGVPRPPINLHRIQNRIDIIVDNERRDNISASMRGFCQHYLTRIENYCGIVLKKNSPSCGLEGVKLYRGEHPTSATMKQDGIGEFAYQLLKILRRRQLSIPVIEDEALRQSDLKRRFVESARNHWKARQNSR